MGSTRLLKAACLAVAILAAGCANDPAPAPSTDPSTQDPEPEGPDQPGNTTNQKAPQTNSSRPAPNASLLWQDCTFYYTSGEIPYDRVEPYMPAGMEATRSATYLTTSVSVHFWFCDALVVDNSTLIDEPEMAWLAVNAKPSETIEGQHNTQHYVFDAWTTNEAVQAMLVDNGAPRVNLAKEIVDDVDGVPGELRLATDNSSIEFESAPNQPLRETSIEITMRFFYATNPYRWMDTHLIPEETGYALQPGILEYSGGVLAKIMGDEEGSWEMHSSTHRVSSIGSFGRQ